MKHLSIPQFKSQPTACFAPRTRADNRNRCSVIVCADDFCRDKVAMKRVDSVAAEGQSTIVFLGAGGAAVEVDARKDTYILDSGLDAGLELPFTCRGGICGACVGRVIEGEVDQSDVPDLLFTMSEDEQAQGMTLLCMARPLSDRVSVETQSDWGYSLGVTEWKGPTGEILGKKVQPLMGKSWGDIEKTE